MFVILVVTDKGTVTGKNILYQLKGAYFEFIGIRKRSLEDGLWQKFNCSKHLPGSL
jgi:hypothetical protein